MNDLVKKISLMRLYLTRLKPWAVIATAASLILVSFYAYQGWQYWLAWDELRALGEEKERISRKVSADAPEAEQLAEELKVQQQRLVQFEDMLEHTDSNRLIGILSGISWETGVELPAISAGAARTEDIGANRYRTQPMSITVQGDVENIYRFILALQERLPIVSLASISVSNPGEEASAQVSLVFYLSPQLIAGAEGAN
jgi:Tfp pilus assembly protein PilO